MSQITSKCHENKACRQGNASVKKNIFLSYSTVRCCVFLSLNFVFKHFKHFLLSSRFSQKKNIKNMCNTHEHSQPTYPLLFAFTWLGIYLLTYLLFSFRCGSNRIIIDLIWECCLLNFLRFFFSFPFTVTVLT